MADYTDEYIEKLRKAVQDGREGLAELEQENAAEAKSKENEVKGKALEAELASIQARARFITGAAQKQKSVDPEADSSDPVTDVNQTSGTQVTDNQDDDQDDPPNPLVNVPGFSQTNNNEKDD